MNQFLSGRLAFRGVRQPLRRTRPPDPGALPPPGPGTDSFGTEGTHSEQLSICICGFQALRALLLPVGIGDSPGVLATCAYKEGLRCISPLYPHIPHIMAPVQSRLNVGWKRDYKTLCSSSEYRNMQSSRKAFRAFFAQIDENCKIIDALKKQDVEKSKKCVIERAAVGADEPTKQEPKYVCLLPPAWPSNFLGCSALNQSLVAALIPACPWLVSCAD